MVQGFSFRFGSKDKKPEKQFIDPKYFEEPLERILSDTNTLEHIINQLAFLLARVDDDSPAKGYTISSPFTANFPPVSDSVETHKDVELTTTL